MKYSEARAVLEVAVEAAEKQGRANGLSIDARLVLMSKDDKKLAEALRMYAERNPSPTGTTP